MSCSDNSSSPSCSSQSDDDVQVASRAPLTATQILAIAIQKRRSLFNSKERDYRRELMHTTVIQTLCKHLGEGRAKRRRRGGKKRHQQLAAGDGCEPPVSKKICVDSSIQTDVVASQKNASTDDDNDPFGLEQFFANMQAERSNRQCQVAS